nr:hypothetical protein Iba_chr07bCG7310 [Ipomoea batatas]
MTSELAEVTTPALGPAPRSRGRGRDLGAGRGPGRDLGLADVTTPASAQRRGWEAEDVTSALAEVVNPASPTPRSGSHDLGHRGPGRDLGHRGHACRERSPIPHDLNCPQASADDSTKASCYGKVLDILEVS